MATKITRPVSRETSAFVREGGIRPLIVTLTGACLELRPKGLRKSETLDVSSLYYMAVKQRVIRERAEKKAARKGKK